MKSTNWAIEPDGKQGPVMKKKQEGPVIKHWADPK